MAETVAHSRVYCVMTVFTCPRVWLKHERAGASVYGKKMVFKNISGIRNWTTSLQKSKSPAVLKLLCTHEGGFQTTSCRSM